MRTQTENRTQSTQTESRIPSPPLIQTEIRTQLSHADSKIPLPPLAQTEVRTQITQTGSRTQAYVNLFAVLGTLENLCELAPEAKNILKGKEVFSIGFFVNGGPQAVFAFKNGRCELREGEGNCTIALPFPSCEKFNGMINGTYTPMPSRGLMKVSLLTKTFVPLTEVLKSYLKPSPASLRDPDFRRISTKLMLYTAVAATAEVGNNDKIGFASASLLPDGEIGIYVKDEIGITLSIRNHELRAIKQPCRNPVAAMVFSNLDAAAKLLNGEINTESGIKDSSIKIHGRRDMIDEMNNILDRVPLYLR